MGQYWHLFNIDRRESCGSVGGKLGECFWGRHHNLANMLAITSYPEGEIPPVVEEWLSGSGGTALSQPGPFGKLAPELLEAVYDGLTELQDIAFLFLTCKLLMNTGKRRLRSAVREMDAPWVGCRLICLGDYSDTDNLPKGLLTYEESRELASAREEDPESECSFYSFACNTYRSARRMGALLDVMHEGSKHLLRHLPEDIQWEWRRAKKSYPVLVADLERFTALCLFTPEREALRWEDAVLCNLSKSEYVRGAGLTVPHADFAHALLSQICWSEDESCALDISDETAKKLVHGRWAGDRFCITTLEKMPSARKGQEWVEITEEVDEMLVDMNED
ncbi:hypothetical protein OH76DRAFT_1371415 [Lentinus brumalis]|uniref:Uncharacterized protein n=1 Tax=Lentinus brumalis TaxID=2498619 RepID=A0A371DS35_9APHY|nr:hypothetical protein OH76DRAFT_1371415 [Polyporus brumalis]